MSVEQPRPGQANARRRRLTSAGILALCVLPIASVALFWLCSYVPGELFLRSESGRLFLFSADADGTSYVYRTDRAMRGAAETWTLLEQAPLQTEVWRLEALGFRVAGHGGPNGIRFMAVAIPYPFILLPTLLPLWLLYHARRRQARLADRLCVKCGYDLRHSGDRCPECGASASATPTA
jgi:hypothetical protein